MNWLKKWLAARREEKAWKVLSRYQISMHINKTVVMSMPLNSLIALNQMGSYDTVRIVNSEGNVADCEWLLKVRPQ